ncbi:MAG: MarR family transcriptional regulator [Limisphaerales bacterium]
MLLLLLAPSFSLSTLLGLQRKLDHVFRNQVLAGTALTAEQATILLELEGTISFGPPGESLHGADGFVGFAALAERLTLTKPALSRRLSDLEAQGWVEQRSVAEAALPSGNRPHGNALQLRITARGRRKTAPVVRELLKLATDLFGSLTPQERAAYCQAFESVSRRVAERLER